MKIAELIPPARLAKGMWWGRAWSLVSGCTRVSEGCDNCWLRAQQNRYRPQEKGCVTIHEARLTLPLRVKKPTVWAVWSDLFHPAVTEEFCESAFDYMGQAKQHIFLVLTKRPERIDDFPWLDYGANLRSNVWLGTTAENQARLDERLPHLLKWPGKKFLSLEPLLGDIDLARRGLALRLDSMSSWQKMDYENSIDWVIAGCEKIGGRPGRLANSEWYCSLRDQCQAAGVPFFLKQAEEVSLDYATRKARGKIIKVPFLDGRQWLQTPEV